MSILISWSNSKYLKSIWLNNKLVTVKTIQTSVCFLLSLSFFALRPALLKIYNSRELCRIVGKAIPPINTKHFSFLFARKLKLLFWQSKNLTHKRLLELSNQLKQLQKEHMNGTQSIFEAHIAVFQVQGLLVWSV